MIVVTGAGGLVGSHLTAELARCGKQVRALYHNSKPAQAMSGSVEWVQADILDVGILDDVLQDATEVYHCAATVSFHPKRKRQMHRVNVTGTAQVVNACLDAGIRKLVHVSSVAALGRIREGQVITEDMKWSEETSNSEYGKTKYLGELEVWRGIGEGLNAVIVNPVIILGAGDWEKGSSEIFHSAYKEFPWYTEGSGGFVYVMDVVRAMMALMDSDISAERFILSGENMAYREVFNLIAAAFGKQKPHRKITPLMAALVWRWEAFLSLFTGKDPMLTRETAATALAQVSFDNSRLLRAIPGFSYTPIRSAIPVICNALQERLR
ncbi:MAG TPA: NAD-dependent epimerase/dehydratase family protein [Sediminibacterium sp.]|nr:NAD-dependent epimerase/dehydratase family protein [Sediminibacterium sp.]